MAFPTAVNDQITDSVTQSNVQVLSSSPAQAIGSLYQIYAGSLSIAIQNATANQQHANTINSAVTTSCVNFLLGENNSLKK
jgi:hypothetical protein